MINLANVLDVRCARACKMELLVNDRPMYLIPNHDRAWLLPPPFSSDLAWSHVLEDEIERRGLWLKYIPRLIEYVNEVEWTRPEEYLLGYSLTNGVPQQFEANVWGMAALIRATPEQKARAFLEAIK